MLPLLTAIAAQFFDLATFVTMVRQVGPHAEANPLVRALFLDYGTPGVALAKTVLVLFVVALAVSSMRKSRAVRLVGAAIPLGFAIVFGLVGGLSNARVILG